MENVNEINIEDKGFYDGVECTVVDIINDITIAVIGPFNFSCFFEAYYKSFFHKILGIKSYKERIPTTDKILTISKWSFKKSLK